MKKISYIICTILFSLLFVKNINAASASISVSANKSQVIVGETVKITVKVSSNEPLGSWTFDVVPTSNLSLTDSSFGGLYVRDVVGSSNEKSKTYTFTFKAKSSGSASVQIKNSSVYLYSEEGVTPVNGKVNLTLKTRSEIEAGYSKNNYLSSLSIEGYDLNFSKDKTEYSLEVPNGTESVKVNATKEDSRSRVSGTGTIKVSEGTNKIDIVVVAQNGSTRTYTINIIVKELNPIEIELNGQKYLVIRKEDMLPKANIYYELSKTTINEEEVPCYISETTKYTLVGLKNETGDSKLFIYKDNKFEEYNEITLSNTFFIVSKPDEIKEGYIATNIKIGDNTYEAYKNVNYEYPLLYGMNVATGTTDFYKYDSVENSIQRFEKVVEVSNNEQLYYYIIIGMFSFIIISYIVFILIIIKNKNKNKELLDKTIKIVDKKQIN